MIRCQEEMSQQVEAIQPVDDSHLVIQKFKVKTFKGNNDNDDHKVTPGVSVMIEMMTKIWYDDTYNILFRQAMCPLVTFLLKSCRDLPLLSLVVIVIIKTNTNYHDIIVQPQ